MERAAYCDVDGTLAATTIVTPLIWLRKQTFSSPAYFLWMASLGVRGPWWLVTDRIDRGASNRAIYRQYRGMPVVETKALAERCYRECIKPRLFPAALKRLKKFQQDGVKIVLVTGGLDFLMRPLAVELDAECVAPGLVEHQGVFNGELDRAPLTGAGKAEIVRDHSRKHGVDLRQSYAMGDAMGDKDMLECVGNPIAVNADARLARFALDHGWQREKYSVLPE